MRGTRRLAVRREVLAELTPEHLGAVVGASGPQEVKRLLEELVASLPNCDDTCKETCTAISNTRTLD